MTSAHWNFFHRKILTSIVKKKSSRPPLNLGRLALSKMCELVLEDPSTMLCYIINDLYCMVTTISGEISIVLKLSVYLRAKLMTFFL